MAEFDFNYTYDYLMKLIIIGDSGVGKTCFLLRFSDDDFNDSHICTIGIDFRIKYLKVGDKKMKLQIWDTAGQEKFRTITYTYYKGAQGVILAYDCSDLNSFKNIGAWMEQISEHASEDVAKILICTKCDVDPSKRVVTKQMGEEIAEQFGLKHFETSAKLDYGVKQAFDYIANEVRLNTDKSKTNTDNKRVRVGQSSSQNSKQSCC